MTFYMSIIVMTELLMLAMTIHVLNYSGFTREQKAWYLLTFISIMVCAAAEFAVHCGYYDEVFAIPLTVVTVLQFSIAPLLGVFFTGALGLHRQARLASFFFSLNLVVEIIAAPFGWVFYFDAEGYHRGKVFILYTAFYLISLLYLIIHMVIVGNKFRRRDVWTIAMILVILVAGIIPMTLFNLNITYIAIAIAASLCYIYYNDLVQQDIQAELVANQKKLSEMQEHMISGLANLIEDRDTETGEHILRTSAYVKTLAENARKEGIYTDELDDRFIFLLYTLAPMHDIGKIVVPDTILRKPGKLTAEEFEQMKKHAAVGGSVVREILNGVTDEEYLSLASDIATYHHEWWNGAGYPKGLKGDEIPLTARIMAIADVYDALISERCYKKAMTAEEAFKIIGEEAGTHFDPKLAAVFLKYREEFKAAGKKKADNSGMKG
ncbi:MAG: HD domain-containing protein [Clostridia bacterium]|nr:HD domain-containing protein [Clostridia bacterium]